MRFHLSVVAAGLSTTIASGTSQDGSLAGVVYHHLLTLSNEPAGGSATCQTAFDAAAVLPKDSTSQLDLGRLTRGVSQAINRFAQAVDNLCLDKPQVGAAHAVMKLVKKAELNAAAAGNVKEIRCLDQDGVHLVSQTLAHPPTFAQADGDGGRGSLEFTNKYVPPGSPHTSIEADTYCALLEERLNLVKDLLTISANEAPTVETSFPTYTAAISSRFELHAAGDQCSISFFGIETEPGFTQAEDAKRVKGAFQTELWMNPQGLCFGIPPAKAALGVAGPATGVSANVVSKNSLGKSVLECSVGGTLAATYTLPFTVEARTPMPTFPATVVPKGQQAAKKTKMGSVVSSAAAAGSTAKSGGRFSRFRRKTKNATPPSVPQVIATDTATAGQVAAGQTSGTDPVSPGGEAPTAASGSDAASQGTPINTASDESTPADAAISADSGLSDTSAAVPTSSGSAHDETAIRYCTHLLHMRDVFQTIVKPQAK